MAKTNKKIVDFFMKWEGKLSRDPKDSASSYPNPMKWEGKSGYHTNMGITYATWERFKGKNAKRAFFEMTHDDVVEIFEKGYWLPSKCDKIDSQAIAVCLVSWAWGSGSYGAAKQLQRMLVKDGKKIGGVDGKIGPKTLKAVNSYDERELFDLMVKTRESFFRYISNPDRARTQSQRKRFGNNARFLNGWLNRLRNFNATFRP